MQSVEQISLIEKYRFFIEIHNEKEWQGCFSYSFVSDVTNRSLASLYVQNVKNNKGRLIPHDKNGE
ncbi:hypothetical protein EDM56_16355 [Brevibacillus fluminis]|uniref:Uncharacterized protein n=1 Tax=Brevibacillus fluminis TaxID=511487 RepID=A0A3M8DGL4_9BACL|nr:hypothetical protein EDM56_16355 [Brevibacillus fluminis]